MKHIFNFIWFCILLLVMCPFLGLLILTTLIYWDGKYMDKGHDLMNNLWDEITKP